MAAIKLTDDAFAAAEYPRSIGAGGEAELAKDGALNLSEPSTLLKSRIDGSGWRRTRGVKESRPEKQ